MPSFSGRTGTHYQGLSAAPGQHREVYFLKRQGLRKQSLEHLKAGAGGLLSVPGFGAQYVF